MSTARRRSNWIVMALCFLAGGLLLADVRSYMPVASAQSFPEWGCAPTGNPCPTCPENSNEWQCLIVLNGWNWGSCLNPFGADCYESASRCGSKADCNMPPNPLSGSDCNAGFNICTTQ